MTKFPELRKICHARVGQQVQLPGESGAIAPEVFVVCALDETGKAPGRPGQTHGLYDDKRQLFLTSLSTGLTRPMPHLSSRAKLLTAAEAQCVPTAPALLPRADAAEVRVTSQRSRGKVVTTDVNLAAPEEVFALLKGLCDGELKITSVQWHTEVLEEELEKEAWRNAVAGGRTLLSFAEFRASAAG